MNITVVGATGQIGAQVVELLTGAGHDVTAASRSSGVDAGSGDGVAAAFEGADAVVDVLNSPTMEPGPAAEFFTGLWETALAADEILTAVSFPVWTGHCGFAVQEFARRHGDFAIAGATLAVELDGRDRVARCGIGLLGMGSTPERGTPAEQAVVGRPVTDITAEEVGRLAVSELHDVPADLQGSPAYRSKVGATMVARAWSQATTAALETREALNA